MDRPMLHDLPRRAFARPWGRRAFIAVSVVFMGVQLFFAVRPALPAPLRANFPWGMFKDANGDNKTIVAWGFTAEGDRVDIDLKRWFQYTRGTTDLRIYDHHPAMMEHKSWHRAEQRAFARWVAHRLYVEDGVRLTEVRFRIIRERIHSGAERLQDVRTVPITPDDYEREIPKEARVDRR